MSNRVRSIKFFTGAQARIMMRLKRPDGSPFSVDGATITAAFLARDGDLISTVTPVSDAAVGADWAAGEVVVVFAAAETGLQPWLDASSNSDLGNYVQLKIVQGGVPTIVETPKLIEIKRGYL